MIRRLVLIAGLVTYAGTTEAASPPITTQWPAVGDICLLTLPGREAGGETIVWFVGSLESDMQYPVLANMGRLQLAYTRQGKYIDGRYGESDVLDGQYDLRKCLRRIAK